MDKNPTYEESEKKVDKSEKADHEFWNMVDLSQFQFFAESSFEGIAIHQDGILLDANNQYFKMFGYEKNELIGKNVIPLTVAPESIEKLKQQLDQKSTSSYTIIGLRKDGSRFDAEIQVRHTQYKGREVRVGVIRDITEQKHIAEAFRKSENKYRSLFKNMLNGFAYCQAIFDGNTLLDFIYLDVNRAFERLTGLKHVIGKKVSEVIPGFRERDPEVLKIYGRVALSGQPETFELYVDTLSIWALVSVYCPEKGYFVATFDVVTERKLAEIERENSIRLFEIINVKTDLPGLVKSLVNFLHEISGCDAVGIRLREGDDFPYKETKGFSDDFIQSETLLCRKDLYGQTICDETGNPMLECMCGDVLCGRSNFAQSFFTDFGSFISNNTTQLIAETTEPDRYARIISRCNAEGYESIMLVPLRTGGETLGLLQFNAYREEYFSKRFLTQMENFSNSISISLAQQLAKKALHESEEKYRILFNTFPLGIGITDKNGNIVETNDIAEKLITLFKNEQHTRVIDGSEWRLIDSTGAVMNIDDYPTARALKENRLIENVEVGFKKNDGEIIWLNATAVPLPLQNYGVVLAYKDITEQKKAQQENQKLVDQLRKSQQFNKTILNASPEIIYIYDIEEKINIYSNEGIVRVLGYSATELKEMGEMMIEMLMHPDDLPIYLKETLPKYQGLKDNELIEHDYRMKHKNGQWRWLNAKESIFLRKDGAPKQIFGIISDITEKRHLEKQLLQSQKMESIGTLAGGIAHDFNNMLSVLTGNISYALSILSKNDELYDVLSDVLQGTKQAQTLTNQLLTFAKGGEPIKKACNVNTLLEDSAKFVTSGAKSRCDFKLADDLWAAEIDPGQIHQVISNLVMNADQAMPNGGIISIQTENIEIENDTILQLHAGKYIKISIEDQGIGIHEKHIPNIFEPYFTTKAKGCGLGLATAYSIVKRHGGYITTYSELGVGTVFNIYLPASSKEVSETKDKEGSKHQGQGRILIMDDQEPILKMAQRMLSRMGYKTEIAMDGGEAIKMYREAHETGRPFDLVVLDLTVPGGIGGAKAILELLKIDPKVKAVVSSGYSNDPIMANYEEYGFCGVVPKPYSKEQLSEVLNKMLEEIGN